MCDYSGKLIAWMDGELPAQEAAEVERHLEACSECRSGVATFRRISVEFDAYCEEATASTESRRAGNRALVVSAAVAAAAAGALFLMWPRTSVHPPAPHFPQVAETPTAVVAANELSAAVHPSEKFHVRRAASHKQSFLPDQNTDSAPAQSENPYVLANEPVVQIAIPADEMFPPGAAPEGMHFVADLTIAADGSAERLRLRPRLAEFERRTTLP